MSAVLGFNKTGEFLRFKTLKKTVVKVLKVVKDRCLSKTVLGKPFSEPCYPPNNGSEKEILHFHVLQSTYHLTLVMLHI